MKTNTKKVIIKVNGSHVLYGQRETLETIQQGTCHIEDGKYIIEYDEIMVDSTGASMKDLITHNTVEITNKLITVIKNGQITTNMTFMPDYIHKDYYKTPFGTLEMTIHTDSMTVDMSEDTVPEDIDAMGTIHIALDYEITLGQVLMPDYRLEYDITPCSG